MFERIRSLMVSGSEVPHHPNVYYPVSDEEIYASETRLGFQLPEQLKTFHQEIGYGFFTSASPQTFEGNFNYINRFLAPAQIADLLLNHDEESSPSEGFNEGEIPFFEVSDQLYLVLRSSLTNLNQVAWPYGAVVCNTLIEFTKRLADNPTFYFG